MTMQSNAPSPPRYEKAGNKCFRLTKTLLKETLITVSMSSNEDMFAYLRKSSSIFLQFLFEQARMIVVSVCIENFAKTSMNTLSTTSAIPSSHWLDAEK